MFTPLLSQSSIQQDIKMLSGCCVYCQNVTMCVCQRCGDFYCSPDCQRKDWQRHRYICTVIPALIHSSAFFDPKLLTLAQSQPTGGIHPIIAQQIANCNMNMKTKNDVHTPKPPVGGMQSLQQQMMRPVLTQQLMNNSANMVNKNDSHAPVKAKQQSTLNIQPKPEKPIAPLPQQQQEKQNQVLKNNNNQSNKKAAAHPQQQLQKWVSTASLDIKLPKTNSRVVLCGFVSTNRCYVREVSPATNAIYINNIEKINCLGKEAKVMVKLPKLYSFALTKNYGSMHRVRILSVLHGIYRVAFIDSGSTGQRKLEELYEISHELQVIPQCGMTVQLDNVRNYDKNDKLLETLMTNVGKEYKIVFTGGGVDKLKFVVMYNWETNENLNNYVNNVCSKMFLTEFSEDELGESFASDTVMEQKTELDKTIDVKNAETRRSFESLSIKEPNPTKSFMITNCEMALKKTSTGSVQQAPVLKPPFEFQPMTMEQNGFKVFIVDNSNLSLGYLGCLPVRSAANLDQIVKYLEGFRDTVPYTPVLLEYIIARYEKTWYRGKVLSINKTNKNGGKPTFTVIFSDFTNEVTLTEGDIRRYPDDLRYDCYTVFCVLADLPNMNDSRAQFLENRLRLRTLIHVDSFMYLNENLAVIKCNALLDELNKISN